MADIECRMFFDNNPASRYQLDKVEEITVDQECDMVWEARIEIPVCVDEDGEWIGENADFMKSFSRVRVEVRIGVGSFIPLIDGIIVGYNSEKSSEPGKSSIILIVQDDSVYLNRKELITPFEKKLDHQIAEQIFSEFEQIAFIEIEETYSSGSTLPSAEVQRGTAMQLLRRLAKRQGMHAYVLPGKSPGQSIGCFKSFTAETDGLPPFILMGPQRNIESFSVKNNAQSPSIAKASSISITDKKIVTRTSNFSDVDLMGDTGSFEEIESEIAVHILPPYQGESVNIEKAVTAEARKSSYAIDATGKVLGQSYQNVLMPYRVVTVKAGSTPESGDYLITQVSHHLTRSNYSQSFKLRRNAVSSTSGSTAADPAGGIH